jgi:hypothetical protein
VSSGTNGSPDNRGDIGADEAYCTSCGEVIKEEAEICPECGVRQVSDQDQNSDAPIPESQLYDLKQLARKDKATVAVVGFLLSPAGYIMVGKNILAVLNFITFNYFLLGFIIVPLHTTKIINDARKELESYGESW